MEIYLDFFLYSLGEEVVFQNIRSVFDCVDYRWNSRFNGFQAQLWGESGKKSHSFFQVRCRLWNGEKSNQMPTS